MTDKIKRVAAIVLVIITAICSAGCDISLEDAVDAVNSASAGYIEASGALD